MMYKNRVEKVECFRHFYFYTNVDAKRAENTTYTKHRETEYYGCSFVPLRNCVLPTPPAV